MTSGKFKINCKSIIFRGTWQMMQNGWKFRHTMVGLTRFSICWYHCQWLETSRDSLSKMSRNQITLGIRSSEGRKRLQISSTASGTTLKGQIKALLNTEEDFVVKKDKNGRPGEEIRFTRTSSLTSFKLKTGDVLYVTPKAGTRFVNEEADENNGNMSTSNSSNSLASMASVTSLKSANNVVIPAFVEVFFSYFSLKNQFQVFFRHFRRTQLTWNCPNSMEWSNRKRLRDVLTTVQTVPVSTVLLWNPTTQLIWKKMASSSCRFILTCGNWHEKKPSLRQSKTSIWKSSQAVQRVVFGPNQSALLVSPPLWPSIDNNTGMLITLNSRIRKL